MKPTIRLLTECYYKRNSDRIANLRLDLLGFVLQISGIHMGSRVFVYEQVLGLIGSAIIQRLAGEGECIFLHRGEVPQSIPCIYAMEFDIKQMDVFLPLRINSLLEARIECDKRKCEFLNDANTINIIKEENKPKEIEMDSDEQRQLDSSEKSFFKLPERTKREKKALSFLFPLPYDDNIVTDSGTLDCICIAIRTTDPVDVLRNTFHSLRLSGTVVIFSSTRQHLIDAHEWLRSRGVINLQICDQFFREYQVLEGQSHPLIQQSVAGGYILSGIKILPKN